MPTLPGSRGISSAGAADRVSCRVIARTLRHPTRPPFLPTSGRLTTKWPLGRPFAPAACVAFASVPGSPSHARRLAAVEDAFRTLPERYLGAERGFDATYHVRLGDVGQTWEIRATEHGARVRKGITSRRPDVVIGTDAGTWLALRHGALNGIEAFSDRLLYVRGDLDRAVGFEGLFRRPNGRPPLLRVHDVR